MGNSASAEPASQVVTQKSRELQTFLESHYTKYRPAIDPRLTGEHSSEAHWATGSKYITHHGRIDSGASGEVHHVKNLV